MAEQEHPARGFKSGKYCPYLSQMRLPQLLPFAPFFRQHVTLKQGQPNQRRCYPEQHIPPDVQPPERIERQPFTAATITGHAQPAVGSDKTKFPELMIADRRVKPSCESASQARQTIVSALE